MITVVSALYDKYDTFKPPPPGCDRAVMFTDDPDGARAAGWSLAPVTLNPSLPPRVRAKGPKCCPQFYLGNTGDFVWIDASLRSTGENIQTLVDCVPKGGVGTFHHRWRDTLTDEARVSAELARYRDEPVLEQAAHYAAQMREVDGHVHRNLYETGCLVWRGVLPMQRAWLAEIVAWSSQDQVSFPYAAWDHSVNVKAIPGSSVDNAWFQWEQHTRIDWE